MDIQPNATPADIVKNIAADLFPKAEPPSGEDLSPPKNGAAPPPPPEGESILNAPSEKSGEKAAPVAGEVPPPASGAPIAPPASPAPPLKALPKSWKKDMEPHWARLPPEVHDYIYNREADVMRGIQLYQQGHQAWQQTVSPFAEILKQHPGVNAVQLFQNLGHNHLALLQAEGPAKIELAKKLLSGYGIDLASLSGEAASQPDATMKELLALRQELYSLKNGFTQTQQSAFQAAVDEEGKRVAQFMSDPKNPYAEEVAPDMLRYIQTGVASDLTDAYEKAVWANPQIRAKLIAEQARTPAPENQGGAKPRVTNIDSSPDAAPRKPKKGDWRSTVDGVVAKNFPST